MSTSRDSQRSADDFIRKGLRFAQLRLLVALRETGQISGAAAQLAMTQPAASRLLAELEHITDTRLYTRHAKGITLTAPGQLLANEAQAVLQRLNSARDNLIEMTEGARGLVRIGSVTAPALELVLPVIRELRVLYPEIELAVDVDVSDKLAESLLSRALDFYIGRLPQGVDARAVTMRRIGPEPLGFIARRNHPLLAATALTVRDCLPYDWVMQPPGGLMRRSVESWLLENGLPIPDRVLGTSSLLLTLAIISETNAIAPVSRTVAEFYGAPNGPGGNIRLLNVTDEISVSTYSVVTRAGEDLSPPAARILAAIEQKIHDMDQNQPAGAARPPGSA